MANLQQLDPDIFTITDLFTLQECDELIAKAEKIGFEAASVRTTSGQKMMTKIRNNDHVVLMDHDWQHSCGIEYRRCYRFWMV